LKIEFFEDIIAWQKGQYLAVEIYSTFGNLKDYGFRDHICRAVVSISNNIAEGFDRDTDAEFVRFLYIASGSCSEVRSMLHLALRLNYIDSKRRDALVRNAIEVSKIIKGFIKSLRKK